MPGGKRNSGNKTQKKTSKTFIALIFEAISSEQYLTVGPFTIIMQNVKIKLGMFF